VVAAATILASPPDYTFPETLDASLNYTSWPAVPNFRNHTIAFTNPSQTAFVMRVEGSLDGSTFFGVDPSNNGNPDTSGNTTYTQIGTYAITIKNTPLNYIRLKLVSYSGGATAAGITAKYRGD